MKTQYNLPGPGEAKQEGGTHNWVVGRGRGHRYVGQGRRCFSEGKTVKVTVVMVELA